MSPGSLTAAALPWLVVAWMVTVVVVALLIYSVVRAVLSKTEPQSLPEVLRALGPMIKGIAQTLARPLLQPTDPREPIPPTTPGQEGGSLYPQLPHSVVDRESAPKMADGQSGEDAVMPIREIS
jgi:hypothetical protein